MAVLNPVLRLRALRLWSFLFALLLTGGLNTFARADVSKEYQIKAAFLFNFAQFIQWPTNIFTNAAEPLIIGVLGDDPFGSALDQTVQDETVENRKIIIERSQRVDDLKNCQLIFISKSEKKHLPDIFSALDSKPIVTVSDTENFARRGGIINFFPEGTKVRFEINLTAARDHGLKISSQLLSLAKLVQPAKEEK